MGLLNASSFSSDFDVKALALIASFIACLYLVISTAIQWYRLSHIPGPLLASVTSLWAYKEMKAMHFNTVAFTLREKYGDMVRISPTGIALSDPEPLWRANSARSSYVRGTWYNTMRFNPFGNSVFNELDIPKHDKRKAQLMSGFSGKGLMDLESNVDTQIAVLVDVLRSRINQAKGQAVVDIGRTLQYFQVDLITQAGLGEAWGDLPRNEDNFRWLTEGEYLVPSVASTSMVPFLRAILFSPYFLRLFGPNITKGWLGALHSAVEKRTKHNQNKIHGGDMLSEWLKHNLPPSEAEFDLAVLMPAGTETSISTIRGILMYLMISPNVYQKLKQEIADGIRKGRISSPVTNEETKQLPYLQAVLNEGLRMAPPLIIGFPKTVPAGGDVICGKHVPEGTEIYFNYSALMRNQEVFGEDVDIFRPERFLECDAATRAKRLKVVDLNFGFGRWSCLGKVLAWMEINKIFVELLRSFDFQVLSPERPWQRKSSIAWVINDFYACITENRIE